MNWLLGSFKFVLQVFNAFLSDGDMLAFVGSQVVSAKISFSTRERKVSSSGYLRVGATYDDVF